MSKALQQLREFCKDDPEITVDEALAICDGLVSAHPQLSKVVDRIEHLRTNRDLLHEVAQGALSSASWERSDLKKWADKQRLDPDND